MCWRLGNGIRSHSGRGHSGQLVIRRRLSRSPQCQVNALAYDQNTQISSTVLPFFLEPKTE